MVEFENIKPKCLVDMKPFKVYLEPKKGIFIR